jgi:hypothetical protein
VKDAARRLVHIAHDVEMICTQIGPQAGAWGYGDATGILAALRGHSIVPAKLADGGGDVCVTS